jgi:hypothetical protein
MIDHKGNYKNFYIASSERSELSTPPRIEIRSRDEQCISNVGLLTVN